MANNNTIKYTLDFTSNLHDTQTQLNALAKSLKNITTMNFNNVDNKLSKNLNEASLAAVKLEKHLKTALNQDTGKIDMVKLNRSLKGSGDSAVKLSQSLMKAGKAGSEAFMNLARTISQAQAPTVRLSETVDKLWGTLKNTMRWQISSSVLNSLTSAFSSAWHYAKELDQTMTKIQVVSGISKEGLDNFTKGAKTAAKELKTSVNEVAKASSIFFQQGDSWETSLRKAETTLKAVNVSFGANAEQMSEYLTAIWNSYNVGAASQELFVDKLAALGAATASSLEEISTAMQKVAATANAVGVNFDQLGSIIATVNSVTRESPETTGTAFKTIFARINDLKVGGSLTEDGFTTTLGDISEGLYEAGLNVLDVNGNLKDTGVIIEQMGNSWQNMTTNQKVAIAQLVAGKRQYTQLMALFENWDKYQENMVTSSKARGTLDRQNEKAMQSINKELEELKGVAIDFWNKIFDKDTVVGLVDMLTDVTKGLDSFVDGFGGFGPLLTQIGAIFMRVFSTQIAGSLRTAKDNFMILIGQGDRLQQKANKEWLNAFQQVKKSADFSDVQLKELSNMEKLIQVTQKFGEKFKGINSETKQYIQMQLDMIKNQQELNNKKHAEAMSEIDSRKRSTSNDLRSTLREVGQSKNMSIRESAIAANDATLKNINFNGMTGNLDDVIMQIANTSDNAGKDISDLGQHLISLMGDAENTSGALDKITESLKSLFQEAQNTISANVEYEIEQDEIAEKTRKVEKNIEANQIIEDMDSTSNTSNTSSISTVNDTPKEFDVGQGFVDVQQMQFTGKKRSKDPINQIIKGAASDLGMDNPDQLSAVTVADLTAKLEEQMATLEEGTKKWNQYKEAIDRVNDDANFDEKSFDKFESAGGGKTSKKDRKALKEKDKENKKSEKKEISSLKKKFKTIEKEEKKSDKKRNKNKNKNRESEEKADKKFLDEKEKQNKNYIKKVEEQEKESAKEKGKILDEISDNIEKSEEKNLNTYEKKVKATSANVGSDIMKVAGAITSIASMWSSVNNAIEVCTDSSASFGEQTMAVVGAVTNGFMTFGQIAEGVKSTQLLINSATVMWGRIRSGEHKKEMAENAAKQVSNTTTALTQAAANWWAAGLILALLAAAGIAAAVNASSSSNVEAAESANKSFSQASAHLEEEKGKLDEINGSLEEKKKELEELKQLQLEGNHQHDAEIARLKNEIGLLEQKKAVQEQKVKIAEKSEQNAAKVFAQTNTAWDTVYTFTGESNGKTLDDYQKAIDEYYQSEEYENALHALEVLDPNSAEYKKIEGELEYISNMSEALVQMKEKGIYNVGDNKEKGREILKQIQDRNTKLEQEALNESVRSDPTQTMERVKQLMKSSGDTFTSEFLNIETGINNLEAALIRGDITQTEFFTSLAKNVKSINMEKAFGDNYEAAEEFFNMVLTYGEGAMNGLTEQFNNGSISTINYMENIMKLNESYVEMGQMAIDRGYISEGAMGKWVEQLKEANEQLEKIKNILPEIGEDSSIKDMASYLSEIGYSAESLGQFAKEKLNIDLDVKTNETIENVLSRSTDAYRIASDAIVEEYQKQMAEVYEAQYMINSTMEKQLNNISMTATKDENGNYIIKTGDDISSSSGDVKQYIEDKNIDVYNTKSRQYFGTVEDQMNNMATYGMQIGMVQASGKDITAGDAYNRMAIAAVQQAVSAGWIEDSALNTLGINKSDVESGNINWQTVQTLQNAGYMYALQPFIDAADKFRQYAVDMKITEGQIDAYSTGRAQAPGIGEAAYGLGPEQMEKAQDAVDKWKDLQEQLEDSYEELADAWDEEYLARLEEDLEKHQQILDEYQKQIDNIDWFNDLLPEDSFLKLQNQTKQYGRNINQLTNQLDEFNRVYNLIPRNAEEAQAIFDQLSSLGDGIQNSVEQIHDLKYELMSLESNMFINLLDENGEILDAEFDRLDKLHESIMDTSEYSESTKRLLLRGGSSALQSSRNRKDRVQKREEEDKKIYDLVKDLNDKIFKKEKELLEMTSKEAAEERAKQRADIEKEIAKLQTKISDAAKEVAEKVGKNNDELIKKLVGDHQQAAALIAAAYKNAIPDSPNNPDRTPSTDFATWNEYIGISPTLSPTGFPTSQKINNVQGQGILDLFTGKTNKVNTNGAESKLGRFLPNNYTNYNYITSPYGDPRSTGAHSGADYGFKGGTQVNSPVYGHVIERGLNNEIWGSYVIIQYLYEDEKYNLKLAHLSPDDLIAIDTDVFPGTKVGTVSTKNNTGGTEYTTYWKGAHLHVGVTDAEGNNIDPTEHFYKYALGIKRASGGKSLVGEIGAELIIYPDGSSYLAGINGPEVLDLPQGTQVFNAQDTQNILNSKGTPNGNIQGFANGTEGNVIIEDNKDLQENTEALKENTEAVIKDNTGLDKEIEDIKNSLKNAEDFEKKFNSNLYANRMEYDFATQITSRKLQNKEISEAQYYVEQGRNQKLLGQIMQNEAEGLMLEYERQRDEYFKKGIYNEETEENLNEIYNKVIELSEKGAEMSKKADEQISEYVQKQIEGLEAISAEIEYQYQLKINAIDKEIQARQNLIDLQKSYNSHMKELRQIENDIEKTLRQSKANVQWLDRETRDLLFNQTDYYEILQKTNSIQSEITQLHANYQEKISNLNEYELDQASLLTEEYEAQVEAKKEELETLKISLQLDEKQNALNSALMERNVRVFAGGRWRQVANIQNVQKTYEDYQNVVDQLKEQEITNAENKAIREEEALNRELELKKAAYEAEIAMMQEENEKLKHELDVMTSEFDISNVSLKKWNEQLLDVNRVMDEAYEGLKNFGKKVNGNFSNGVAYSSYNGGGSSSGGSSGGGQNSNYVNWAKNQMAENSKNWFGADKATQDALAAANKNLASQIGATQDSNGHWIDKNGNKITGNARGRKDGPGGISQVNELGIELLATNSGQFIELNPHEKIFNNEQMNFLYDFSRRGIESTEKAVSSVSAYNDESMTIENLTLELPNVTDTNSFVEGLKGLKEHMRNVKTIK